MNGEKPAPGPKEPAPVKTDRTAGQVGGRLRFSQEQKRFVIVPAAGQTTDGLNRQAIESLLEGLNRTRETRAETLQREGHESSDGRTEQQAGQGTDATD